MEDLIGDKKFNQLLKTHCYEILKHLITKKINFSVICKIDCVKFEPQLPKEISSTFGELTVFILAGYTFESLELDENNLYFEAGFGKENIGSFVSVPLDCIVQVVLSNDEIRSDFCVYINLLASFMKKDEENDGISSSMKALLSNPKNQKYKK